MVILGVPVETLKIFQKNQEGGLHHTRSTHRRSLIHEHLVPHPDVNPACGRGDQPPLAWKIAAEGAAHSD
jgi:hypothetical protein